MVYYGYIDHKPSFLPMAWCPASANGYAGYAGPQW